ncbi:hypothetical protein [Sediminibacillus massiliensis]|uniref:hypothetical protein n=1 Tax=Sediminibacillus massiliensis TaxID=1926277 RepID=UPI0009883D59|nr:hypothetical protein [Sediminibacillus massiliensis]
MSKLENINLKSRIGLNFCITVFMFLLFQISIFPYLSWLSKQSVESISSQTVTTLVLFIFGMNLFAIIISLLFTGLVAYFFGVIFDANASKAMFIYIVSASNLVVYFINLPLAVANFFNQSPNQVVLLNEPILLFLNPLIYLSLYVFYKLLKKHTMLSQKIIIAYCFFFFVMKLAGIFVSQMQLAFI